MHRRLDRIPARSQTASTALDAKARSRMGLSVDKRTRSSLETVSGNRTAHFHALLLLAPEMMKLGQNGAVAFPRVSLGAVPVAVLGAISKGVPVNCAIIGGTPEMVAHEQAGFLLPRGDKATLTEILARRADIPQERKRVGDVGQAHAHDHFFTSSSAATFIRSFRQCGG